MQIRKDDLSSERVFLSRSVKGDELRGPVERWDFHLFLLSISLVPTSAFSGLLSVLSGPISALLDLWSALWNLKLAYWVLKSAFLSLSTGLLQNIVSKYFSLRLQTALSSLFRPLMLPVSPHWPLISPLHCGLTSTPFYGTLSPWGLLPCFLLQSQSFNARQRVSLTTYCSLRRICMLGMFL